MRIENLVVNCTARYPRTCRRTPFEVVVYELNYSSEDKVQSPNQKIPDRKTKCVIKTHINIKQNVIFGAKLKPV